MSNDIKTLADPQPGGRVWLATVLYDRAHDLLGDAYNAGTHGIGYSQQAMELHDAIIPAQPSPGCQGDSRSERAATFLRQYLTYLRSSPRQGLRPRWCDVYEALEVAIEALAARQPVGEPVAWVHEEDPARVISARQKATALRDQGASGSSVRPYSVPAYLHAPAAQAVDLGRGVKAIAAERERQLQAEGFTRVGDQQYRRGELAKAATAYVQLAAMDLEAGGRNHIAWHGPAAVWPWAPEWWKPVDARRDLVRAGALIAAQIDLIDSLAVGNG